MQLEYFFGEKSPADNDFHKKKSKNRIEIEIKFEFDEEHLDVLLWNKTYGLVNNRVFLTHIQALQDQGVLLAQGEAKIGLEELKKIHPG